MVEMIANVRRAWRGLALIPVAMVTVAGCGDNTRGDGAAPATTPVVPMTLTGSDFKGVCQGATVSRAAPYSAAGSHKVVMLSPDNKANLVEDTSTLPADWMVQSDSAGDAYTRIDTVACVQIATADEIRTCDGYKDGDKPTKNTVKLNSTTYNVSVREATTGKVLGATTLASADESCPMFVFFDNDAQVQNYYAPPSSDELIAFLKPFVQP
ncbi:hypothetical protein [Nocardia sp. alder85J]|uniref:hypothetical protein n=1 Tax=Nocardia sp. alder85J TaxID=2862949 RepID=UPI001CD2619A|nr:hypothetical protein [Nocardia sp. alder85J]MCX4094436.1 hypothetical protein [Nocardia sp. alder85J]